MPNGLKPGNKVSIDKMNELAEDDEWANTTILLWYRIAFQI